MKLEYNVLYEKEDYAHDVIGLSKALECFRNRTESDYISRDRLIELATNFKDGLYGACLEDEEYEEFFVDECCMTNAELNFFEIDIDDYDYEDDE